MKENPGASDRFALGVDISDGHGSVDWKTASVAGVTFGYVTATKGVAEPGKYFAENWREMRREGVLRGARHHFQPLKDPEAQAQHFIQIAGDSRDADLPPAVRLKAVQTHTGLNEWDALRKDRRLAVVMRYLVSIEQAMRRRPVIFSNEWFLRSQLGDLGELGSYDLWIADYGKAGVPTMPPQWGTWRFWRFSESGEIGGISGRASLDRFNGSASDLRQYAHVGETARETGTEGTQEDTVEPPQPDQTQKVDEKMPPDSEPQPGQTRTTKRNQPKREN